MHALVTGGSGVVGGAVARRLLLEGAEVSALVRSDSAKRIVEQLGARPVRGDLFDEAALYRAMSGCEVVYHAAGLNAFCLRTPEELYQINVEGSRNVVDAAVKAGVRRIVYTSSAATLGEKRGTIGGEDSPHRGWFLSDYEKSKYEAERRILERADRDGIEIVCVNPSSVQGPGRAGGTTRLLVAVLTNKLKFVVDTNFSVVDIHDCAEGHVLAAAAGTSGERYVLNGAVLSVRAALDMVAEIAGVTVRPKMLPPPVALAAAAIVEGAARARRRSPPLCREMVRTLLHGHRYDGSKATRDLGLVYTPIERTLARTVEWLVAKGFVLKPPTWKD